ncbi:MAG: glycosyltransferase family 2 protein, partial [Actinobacteria bacterium]|nr:glycosyltransferase family 2 protein [Actinomycetota bacterium]
LALGAAVTVRTVGQPVVIIALVYAVATAGPGWRRRLVRGSALVAAAALPIAGCALLTAMQYGHPALGASRGRMMYGRAATFADCRGLSLPAYERSLCPDKPVDLRPGVDDFMWGTDSPASTYRPPRGLTKDQVFGDFAMRIFRHQPLGLAAAITGDFLRGFAPEKNDLPGEVAVERWRFQLGTPVTIGIDPARIPALVRSGGMYGQVDPGKAAFLRGYQLSAGYLPGTAVGVCLLLGVLAVAGLGRARRSPLRGACFVVTATTGGTLLAASLVEFSWRYQLPGIALAPVAGALALTAMLARRPDNQPAPDN